MMIICNCRKHHFSTTIVNKLKLNIKIFKYAFTNFIHRRYRLDYLHCVHGKQFLLVLTILSAEWSSGSKRHFYDDHDHKVDGSTPTQASLLHP